MLHASRHGGTGHVRPRGVAPGRFWLLKKKKKKKKCGPPEAGERHRVSPSRMNSPHDLAGHLDTVEALLAADGQGGGVQPGALAAGRPAGPAAPRHHEALRHLRRQRRPLDGALRSCRAESPALPLRPIGTPAF